MHVGQPPVSLTQSKTTCIRPIRTGRPHEPVLIKHLKLTGNAATYFGCRYPDPFSFSGLLTLDIPFGHSESERAKAAVLKQATHLQELSLHSAGDDIFFTSECKYTDKDPLRHLHTQAYTTLTRLCLHIKYYIMFPSDIFEDPWQGLCREENNTLRKLKALEDLTIAIWVGGRWKDMTTMDAFTDTKWENLDKTLLPLGPAGPFANPHLRRVEVVVGVYGNCASAPKLDTDLFCSDAVFVRAREGPCAWLRNTMQRGEGQVQAIVRTAVMHENCRKEECPYKKASGAVTASQR